MKVTEILISLSGEKSTKILEPTLSKKELI